MDETTPPLIRGFYPSVDEILDRFFLGDVVGAVEESKLAKVSEGVNEILQLEHKDVTGVVIAVEAENSQLF